MVLDRLLSGCDVEIITLSSTLKVMVIFFYLAKNRRSAEFIANSSSCTTTELPK